jgi:ubiquitin-activating enzyme E1 C
VERDVKFERVLEMLTERQDMYVWYSSLFARTDTSRRQIKKPSLSGPNGPLFFQAPKQLYEATKGNLEKEIGEVLQDGDQLNVTDRALPFTLTLKIKFTK